MPRKMLAILLACLLATRILAVDYSSICKDHSTYTPTAPFYTSGTCDQAMNWAAANTLKHIDFSSEFTCGGVMGSNSQGLKAIINSYSAKCCGGGHDVFACKILMTNEYPNEKWSWVTASGKNICAGINTNCGDWTVNPPNKLSSCTTLGVGPCEGTATSPASYLKMAFSGIRTVASGGGDGFWNPTTTNPSGAKNLFPFDGPSYRDYKADVPSGDTKYTYTMVGNTFSNASRAMGYVGIASYLLTGDKDLVTNSNNFYVYKGNGPTARVDRSNFGVGLSESTIGAPDGPYKVCISKFDDTATDKCGADRTFKSGDYKFSVFGHFYGNPDFTDVDQFVVRMKLSTAGTDSNFARLRNLKVNGKRIIKTGQAQVHTYDDVQSIELDHSSGTLKIDFPTDYNVGSTVGADATGEKMMNLIAGKNVKIRVDFLQKHQQGEVDVDYIYLDFLFETSSLGQDTYFVYDPIITESKTVKTFECPSGWTRSPDDKPALEYDQTRTKTCGKADTYIGGSETVCECDWPCADLPAKKECVDHVQGMCCEPPKYSAAICETAGDYQPQHFANWPQRKSCSDIAESFYATKISLARCVGTIMVDKVEYHYRDLVLWMGRNGCCGDAMKTACGVVPTFVCPSGSKRSPGETRAWPDIEGDTRTCGLLDGNEYFFESSAIDHLLTTCCESGETEGEEDTSTSESVTLTVAMVFVLVVLVGF